MFYSVKTLKANLKSICKILRLKAFAACDEQVACCNYNDIHILQKKLHINTPFYEQDHERITSPDLLHVI